MADYWPTREAMTNDPIIAGKMNSLSKVVFSRTLERVDWPNSRQAQADLATEVAQLKQHPGKDMAILGSGSIVLACTELGLIDKYQFMVNPVVLGAGRSMFDGLKGGCADRRGWGAASGQ
jgi:dihydrofolate reductase